MSFLRKLFGQENIEPLIAALSTDQDKKVQESAIETLGKIGAPAVEPLIAALKDRKARENAREALVKIGAPAIKPLIAASKDPDVNVRKNAIMALGKIGAPAIEALIVALMDEDKRAGASAAIALGEIGDASAVAPLIATLRDRDRGVWREASDALAKIGSLAVDPLIAALTKDNGWLSRMAVNILGDIGDARAVEPLIAALKDSNTTENAIIALGKIADARAVEALIAALKDINMVTRAATALGKIADVRAVEPLIAVLLDRNMAAKAGVGEVVTEVLSKTGDRRIVAPFVAILKDEARHVTDKQKEHAALALAGMDSSVLERRQAIAPLIAWHTKFGVGFGSAIGTRHVSLQALDQIDPEWPTSQEARDAIPLLAEIIKHETRNPGYEPPNHESSRRRRAIELLVLIHAPVIEALISAIACWDGPVRTFAEEVLGKHYPDWPRSEAAGEAIPFLIAAFGPESGTQNRRAVNFEGIRAKNALTRIGSPAVQPLIMVMSSVDPRMREYAASTLGEIGDACAVETLRNALKDDDEQVRYSAQFALEKLEK